jgi:DNA-directed RNA polymerase specialized sigma24 family protein
VEPFESILRESRPRVLSFCQHVLTDPQEVLDATDQTFLRLEQALSYYKSQPSPRQLVDRIADSVCRDQLWVRLRGYGGSPGGNE